MCESLRFGYLFIFVSSSRDRRLLLCFLNLFEMDKVVDRRVQFFFRQLSLASVEGKADSEHMPAVCWDVTVFAVSNFPAKLSVGLSRDRHVFHVVAAGGKASDRLIDTAAFAIVFARNLIHLFGKRDLRFSQSGRTSVHRFDKR